MIKIGAHEIKGIRVGNVAIGKVMRGASEIWSAVPDAMVVENAPQLSANGVYFRDGDAFNRPRYVKGSGASGADPRYTIASGVANFEYTITSWFEGTGGSLLYKNADGTAADPSLVSEVWTTGTTPGTPTDLTVRRAIASDFE